MSLFARAAANVALFPAERALLRFLKSLWLTVLLATLPVFSSLITALGTNALSVDWRSYGYRLLAAVGTSLALAIQKYFSAQGDGTPNLNAPVTLQSAVLSAPDAQPVPLPPPPATTAPASPSYEPPVVSVPFVSSPLQQSGGVVSVPSTRKDAQLILSTNAANAAAPTPSTTNPAPAQASSATQPDISSTTNSAMTTAPHPTSADTPTVVVPKTSDTAQAQVAADAT